MLLQTKNELKVSYPREDIEACKRSKNRIFRRPNGLRADALQSQPSELTLLEQSKPKQFGLYDYFDVQDFTYSPENGGGHVKITISLKESVSKMEIHAQITDEKEEVVLAELSPVSAENKSQLVLEGDYKVNVKNGAEDQVLGIIAVGKWGNGSVNDNELSVFKEANGAGVEWQYSHKYPKKEQKPMVFGNIESGFANTGGKGSKDNIVIALIRHPHDESDVDYICGAGRGKNQNPNLCVPGEGTVQFPAGYKSAGDVSARCCLYKNTGGAAIIAGTAEYKIENAISIEWMGDNSFSYSFMAWTDDSNNPITFTEGGGWTAHLYDYELVIQGGMYDTLNNYCPYEIAVRSNGVSATDEVRTLQIMWGCVAPDTLILMGNGERIPISRIQKDSYVKGKNGATLRVINVWQGPENRDMLRISGGDTEDTRFSVFMTGSHPVWIRDVNGRVLWKRAADCGLYDEVLTEQGTYVPINSIVREKPCEVVYNLELEPLDGEDGAIGMYCNGIFTGDNNIQNGIGVD